MPYIYSEPEREHDAHTLPDVEVFYVGLSTVDDLFPDNDGDTADLIGWYWWYCFPGCLPDGEPMGPFKTRALAEDDAREYAAE